MRTALKTLKEPDDEVVTLQELKDHLRITTTNEDGYLGLLNRACRRTAETYCSSRFISTQLQFSFDGVPGNRLGRDDRMERWSRGSYGGQHDWHQTGDGNYFELPLGPLLTIGPPATVDAIIWYQSDQTVLTPAWVNGTDYWVDDSSPLPRVVLTDGGVWPSNLRPTRSVDVQFTVGFGADHTFVPEEVKMGIKRIAANAYRYRTDLVEIVKAGDVPADAATFLAPYRLRWL